MPKHPVLVFNPFPPQTQQGLTLHMQPSPQSWHYKMHTKHVILAWQLTVELLTDCNLVHLHTQQHTGVQTYMHAHAHNASGVLLTQRPSALSEPPMKTVSLGRFVMTNKCKIKHLILRLHSILSIFPSFEHTKNSTERATVQRVSAGGIIRLSVILL